MNGRHGEAEPEAVDWGLLADHLGGALAGSPGGARVAERVASDPAWAAAAAELAAGLDAVAADLRALPEPGAMPEDVTARLDAALRAAGPLAPARPGRATSRGRTGSASTGSGTGSTTGSGPGQPGGQHRPPPRRDHPRRHRRFVRWGGGVAAAAGLVAFAAFGLSNLTYPQRGVSEQDGLESAPGAAADPPTMITGDPVLLASGMDYQQRLLGGPGPASAPGITGEGLTPDTTDRSGGDPPAAVPAELTGLWTDPQLRTACLSTVITAFQPAAISIESIDFARFQGEPALVMSVAVADGGNWIWVAGPRCGTAAAGSDLRFRQELS